MHYQSVDLFPISLPAIVLAHESTESRCGQTGRSNHQGNVGRIFCLEENAGLTGVLLHYTSDNDAQRLLKANRYVEAGRHSMTLYKAEGLTDMLSFDEFLAGKSMQLS